MERKAKEKKEKYITFSIRLPEKLVWEIESLASDENRKRNNMIEQLLWSAVAERRDTHDPSLI
jgi:metal-responsive CopG/Arc/MetJ family transcriptional regulator